MRLRYLVLYVMSKYSALGGTLSSSERGRKLLNQPARSWPTVQEIENARHARTPDGTGIMRSVSGEAMEPRRISVWPVATNCIRCRWQFARSGVCAARYCKSNRKEYLAGAPPPLAPSAANGREGSALTHAGAPQPRYSFHAAQLRQRWPAPPRHTTTKRLGNHRISA